MRLLILSSLLFFFSLPCFSQKAVPRLEQLDVQLYVFQLKLSDESNLIEGSASLAIRFLQPLPEFSLDLVKKAGSGEGMQVSAVYEDGQPIEYRHEGESLTLYPAPGIDAGTERMYQVDYQGVPADGLIISENKYGDRTFFGDNWPNRAHHWLPCVDHPSDKARVEFIVTAPDHYQVVGNGLQIEETNLDDETTLTHWRSDTPLPMKVAVIGAARFGVQLAGDVEGIPISSWVYRQDREAGYYDYSQAVGILQFFIDKFGPYAYPKLANVQSKTRYGGMENASNIFYFENSVTGERSHEDLIAHEIAHQWFGNSASEKNWFHIWLSEGFATYGADLYIEHQYGRERMVERLQSERQQVIALSKRQFTPIVDTTVTDWNVLLNANSYQKGAWVLHMLRHKVGEAAFWRGMQQYYALFRGGNALTEDFQRTMEAASKQNLQGFFRQWLYRPGQPELKVEWDKPKRNRLRLRVSQTQGGDAFEFPLEVKAISAGGKLAKQWTVEVKKKETEVLLKCKFEPAEVILDPDTWLLFSD